ncbi:wiskott-Aldrich syndrome protein homolog 1-like [Anopheles albimanus]|uniref:wiskott-Aldrich syndrome protein homolog 1-like n=1 Tax=Anopheles albimanus TaxID=7167 RepID=UPI001641F3DA|nr:wiskott-Aldrich syndrome protein homolog 1-like [Anopheles albimanus]
MPPPNSVGQYEQPSYAGARLRTRMARGYVNALPPLVPPAPAPAPAPASSTTVGTVPRKRRPRAVGEVFVSSTSSVYLFDRSDPAPAAATEEEEQRPGDDPGSDNNSKNRTQDPVYENFVLPGDSYPAVSKSPAHLGSLCVVRVRQPDPDRKVPHPLTKERPLASEPKPPVVPPRRKHTAKPAVQHLQPVIVPESESGQAPGKEEVAVGDGDLFEQQLVSAFLATSYNL